MEEIRYTVSDVMRLRDIVLAYLATGGSIGASSWHEVKLAVRRATKGVPHTRYQQTVLPKEDHPAIEHLKRICDFTFELRGFFVETGILCEEQAPTERRQRRK